MFQQPDADWLMPEAAAAAAVDRPWEPSHVRLRKLLLLLGRSPWNSAERRKAGLLIGCQRDGWGWKREKQGKGWGDCRSQETGVVRESGESLGGPGSNPHAAVKLPGWPQPRHSLFCPGLTPGF